MTDDEAVLRCQDGDREAFRHLVEQYKNPLYGTAYLMTGNAAQAEEHVQDAFLLAWRGIKSFQRGRPLKPWLMRILRQALAQLTPEHRQVVVLRYFADLTVPQVARSAGVREGTVKSRLHRALRQMRELLEQSGVMEVAGNGA